MDKKTKQWCAVPGCMGFINPEKRHFFRFPKEYDRWLKWIQASKRMDLKLKGPKYAYENCTLCHLHFEEKWLIKKSVIRLHPDAVPTIFFGPAFQKENTEIEGKIKGANFNIGEEQKEQVTKLKQQEATRSEMEEAEKTAAIQEGSKSNVQTKEMDIQTEDQIDDKDKQSTSNTMRTTKKKLDDSPRKRKLRMQILKLKKQNNKLRQMVRRLRLKKEKQKKSQMENVEINEGTSDANNILRLGG